MFAEQCEQPRTRDWCVPDMSHTVKLINMKGTVIVSQCARMTRGHHEDDSCRSIVWWMYCRVCEAPLGAVASARCGPSMCSNAFFSEFHLKSWNGGGPLIEHMDDCCWLLQGLIKFSQFRCMLYSPTGYSRTNQSLCQVFCKSVKQRCGEANK